VFVEPVAAGDSTRPTAHPGAVAPHPAHVGDQVGPPAGDRTGSQRHPPQPGSPPSSARSVTPSVSSTAATAHGPQAPGAADPRARTPVVQRGHGTDIGQEPPWRAAAAHAGIEGQTGREPRRGAPGATRARWKVTAASGLRGGQRPDGDVVATQHAGASPARPWRWRLPGAP
jgi:hypothetical protein